jgi:tetratricopeptide (TPR) repeat protein
LLALPVRAELTVRASVNPPRAAVGEWITLTIEASGAQNVSAPSLAFDGFEVRYRGPSTQVTIVNGQMNASVQHHYLLQAREPGRYTLGPFTVEHQGKSYSAPAVTVEIGAAGQPPPGMGGEQLRVTLSVPRTELFLHERLPVDVTLYVGQVRAGDLQYPVIGGEGFSLERFPEPTQNQEVIQGRTYQVVRFHTTLTALRTGTLNVGPATLQLSVYERKRGAIFDDPFFSDRRPTTLRSEVIVLNVLPFPEENRPAGFSGAVGRFDLEVSAAPTELHAGDPITLRMTVRGQGNLADIQAPVLSDSSGFRIYEARPAGGDDATRIFEQVLIPNESSVTAIPPVRFAYFDPETRLYQTRESAPIPLVVHAAQQSQKAEILAAGAPQRVAAPEELGRDIVFIKDAPGRLRERHRGMGIAFWLWQPLPALLALAAWWYDRRRARLSGDVRYARFTRAGKQAQLGLREATVALERQDRVAFYDYLARTLRDYLAAKLDLPPGAVDAESVAARGLSNELAARVRGVFTACEEARFAPSTTEGDMRGTLAEVQEIVRQMERRRSWGGRGMLLAAAILTVAFVAPLWASDSTASPQTSFFRGNAEYAEGRYAEAVAAYDAVLAAGLESGPLYFNLGNAYFKIGDRGRAILQYERAQRLMPGDPDVLANLSYARSLTGAEACEMPFWQRWLFPFSARLTAPGMAWLISLAFALSCTAFAVFRLMPQHPRVLLQLATVAMVLALVVLASALHQRLTASPAEQAVLIAASDTPARFQPASDGTEHFVLKPGALLRVVEEREDWAQVERCDGRRGWIPRAAFERLNAAVR